MCDVRCTICVPIHHLEQSKSIFLFKKPHPFIARSQQHGWSMANMWIEMVKKKRKTATATAITTTMTTSKKTEPRNETTFANVTMTLLYTTTDDRLFWINILRAFISSCLHHFIFEIMLSQLICMSVGINTRCCWCRQWISNWKWHANSDTFGFFLTFRTIEQLWQ